ncbi:hypothetical protein ACOI1H_01040 [Loktanella sp. DJP18]|uniref:hypothetical protein n=1 Tax=Loktanella sp. DJP18 TaxID=3409788 RepID=UPI003BB76F7F
MKAATRKAVTAGSTFCVALGIGFVMQYGDALASRLGVDEPIGGPADRFADVKPIVNTGDIVAVPSFMTLHTPADSVELAAIPREMVVPVMQMPGLSFDAPDTAPTAVRTDALTTTPMLAAPKADLCSPVMTATAQPMAMVRLTLADACQLSAPVTIHHQGMMFSAMTDADGLLTVDVPALARDALFMADFKAGSGAEASVQVPDLSDFDRAVLQWQGDDGMQLHALEFGAGYDDAGHIWAASVGKVDLAAAGTGGVLTSLGDGTVSNALRAEVYTYPTGRSARDGQIVLNVEAEITSGNCGRDVAAQSIQIGPYHPADAVDLTMTMPGCDAIGEFLVLNNMFADLTLAAK